MKDDLTYTPSSCFATFPFPANWETHAALERVGAEYHAFRAKLMADPETRAELMDELPPEGLTATYNRFHDRLDVHDGIVELRRLHAAMDRAVLEAYGWWDELSARSDWGYAFRDVHAEVDESEDGADDAEREDGEEREERPAAASSARGVRVKQRYGWSEGVRDELLARLLQLNGERARAEADAARAAKATREERPPRSGRTESAPLVLSGESEASGTKKGRGRKKA